MHVCTADMKQRKRNHWSWWKRRFQRFLDLSQEAASKRGRRCSDINKCDSRLLGSDYILEKLDLFFKVQ